jgi:antitoxin component of MazEF toxin-antitoxin module
MSCEVKRIGGSRYIVINTVVLDSLNLTDGDVVLVDFKEKVSEIEIKGGSHE